MNLVSSLHPALQNHHALRVNGVTKNENRQNTQAVSDMLGDTITLSPGHGGQYLLHADTLKFAGKDDPTPEPLSTAASPPSPYLFEQDANDTSKAITPAQLQVLNNLRGLALLPKGNHLTFELPAPGGGDAAPYIGTVRLTNSNKTLIITADPCHVVERTETPVPPPIQAEREKFKFEVVGGKWRLHTPAKNSDTIVSLEPLTLLEEMAFNSYQEMWLDRLMQDIEAVRGTNDFDIPLQGGQRIHVAYQAENDYAIVVEFPDTLLVNKPDPAQNNNKITFGINLHSGQWEVRPNETTLPQGNDPKQIFIRVAQALEGQTLRNHQRKVYQYAGPYAVGQHLAREVLGSFGRSLQDIFVNMPWTEGPDGTRRSSSVTLDGFNRNGRRDTRKLQLRLLYHPANPAKQRHVDTIELVVEVPAQPPRPAQLVLDIDFSPSGSPDEESITTQEAALIQDNETLLKSALVHAYADSLAREEQQIRPTVQSLLRYATASTPYRLYLGNLPEQTPVQATIGSSSIRLVGGSSSSPTWTIEWERDNRPGVFKYTANINPALLDDSTRSIGQLTTKNIQYLLRQSLVNAKGGRMGEIGLQVGDFFDRIRPYNFKNTFFDPEEHVALWPVNPNMKNSPLILIGDYSDIFQHLQQVKPDLLDFALAHHLIASEEEEKELRQRVRDREGRWWATPSQQDHQLFDLEMASKHYGLDIQDWQRAVIIGWYQPGAKQTTSGENGEAIVVIPSENGNKPENIVIPLNPDHFNYPSFKQVVLSGKLREIADELSKPVKTPTDYMIHQDGTVEVVDEHQPLPLDGVCIQGQPANYSELSDKLLASTQQRLQATHLTDSTGESANLFAFFTDASEMARRTSQDIRETDVIVSRGLDYLESLFGGSQEDAISDHRGQRHATRQLERQIAAGARQQAPPLMPFGGFAWGIPDMFVQGLDWLKFQVVEGLWDVANAVDGHKEAKKLATRSGFSALANTRAQTKQALVHSLNLLQADQKDIQVTLQDLVDYINHMNEWLSSMHVRHTRIYRLTHTPPNMTEVGGLSVKERKKQDGYGPLDYYKKCALLKQLMTDQVRTAFLIENARQDIVKRTTLLNQQRKLLASSVQSVQQQAVEIAQQLREEHQRAQQLFTTHSLLRLEDRQTHIGASHQLTGMASSDNEATALPAGEVDEDDDLTI